MSKIYAEELLMDWISTCLRAKAYPIEVTIKIAKNGKFIIEQPIDGRRLRNRFVIWMANQFFSQTNIVPPKNKTSKAFNKTWTMPLEGLLRQAVYTGGVDYDELKPDDKYSKLNGLCFSLVLKDTIEKQREDGLTIAQPLSIEKVGISIASQGTHYKRAKIMYQTELERQLA